MMPHWIVACVLALAVGAGGCTAVTRSGTYLIRKQRPDADAAAHGHPLTDGYRDMAGVIHVHTTYSDDAHGTLEGVARVANAQGLDFVIVTEHNTLQPLREGKQGRHGAVLVLIGMEISTRGGHYLAMNVTEEIDRHTLDTQQIIDEVNRQGGLGFIAHPYFKKRHWTDWNVTGFTGIEGYNVAHDTLDENRLRLGMWTLLVPNEPFYWSILDRPYDPLRAWDRLIRQHGRVVGIGSCDAHEFHLGTLKFASYDDMFRLSRTHVLVPPGQARLEPAVVYDALRAGRAYFSIELTAEARGFEFFAHDGERTVAVMGEEVALTPGLHLTAIAPFPGQFTLMRDGQPVATTTGTTWQVQVTTPGVYRMEVSRHAKPWIFSNPIYVRPALAPSQG